MNDRKLKRQYRLSHINQGRRRWSKLGRDIKALFAPGLPLQIHCNARPPNCKFPRGMTMFPRYWITLGKETIFDYPSDFLELIDHEAADWEKRYSDPSGQITVWNSYPFEKHGVSEISCLLRDYINRPKEALMEPFENDRWGLADILRAADRRIGKQRLEEMETDNPGVNQIISMRLKQNDLSQEQKAL